MVNNHTNRNQIMQDISHKISIKSTISLDHKIKYIQEQNMNNRN